MTFSIRIKENEAHTTPWRFEREFASEADFQRVNQLCINRERVVLEGALYVVRTDTKDNFCKDFFFPLAARAEKIQKAVERVFVLIVAYIFDLLTLPIRCITLIPRLVINWTNAREKHPLHKYLVEQHADPQILNRDHVYMQKTIVRPNGYEDVIDTRAETFNFIELPSHEHQATTTEYLNVPARLMV
jgi:hypothetical protein